MAKKDERWVDLGQVWRGEGGGRFQSRVEKVQTGWGCNSCQWQTNTRPYWEAVKKFVSHNIMEHDRSAEMTKTTETRRKY